MEVRGTHFLERAEVGTSQDIERKKASKMYLLAREGRGQGWSRHRIKTS